MKTSLRARALSCALLATTAFCGLTASPAQAQTEAPPPPVRQAVDANGVNLLTGKFTAGWSGPGIGLLAYHRVWDGDYWHDNLWGTINTGAGGTKIVSIGGASETFTLVSGAYQSNEGTGATLAYNNVSMEWTYKDAGGGTATFRTNHESGLAQAQALITSYVRPSGEKLTYHYNTIALDPGTPGFFRLQSVTSSDGHQLHFDYQANTLDESAASWLNPVAVTAINNGVEYCSPIADSCALSGSWPTATLNLDANSFSDAMGRTTSFTTSSGRITGVRLPGSGSDDVAISYDGSGRVASVNDGAGTWTYAYSDSGNIRTTTITNPLSQSRTIASDIVLGLVKSVTDELSRTTGYEHDSQGRLTKITRPEGNYVQYSYDARGNVTETRAVAKSGSGLADIVATASYNSTCTVAVKCNKPNSITDARGNMTDFTYDSTHGLLTVTLPAATSGATRPQKRYGYTSMQAYAKAANGQIQASGVSTYKLTSTSECMFLLLGFSGWKGGTLVYPHRVDVRGGRGPR